MSRTDSMRVVVVAASLVAASPALACPVCGGGGLNQQAYIDMTIFMSLLPLSLLGLVAFVLWRNHKAAVKAQEEAYARGEGGPSSSTSSAAM